MCSTCNTSRKLALRTLVTSSHVTCLIYHLALAKAVTTKTKVKDLTAKATIYSSYDQGLTSLDDDGLPWIRYQVR